MLEVMCSRTDGRFIRVDPGEIPQMDQAMQEIIDAIESGAPVSIRRRTVSSFSGMRVSGVSTGVN